MTYTEYCASLAGKRVAVLGIGVSNRPLIRLLCEAGAIVSAHDRKSAAALGDTVIAELKALGVKVCLGDTYLDDLDADIVFRSPSMRPDMPALAAAREKGAVVTSEMEAFFEVCPCPIIAITGSEGKTTTSSLIADMLTRAGYTCHLGGNIGHPLLADTPDMTSNDFAVVELSSFQLMSMSKTAHIAVITNVTPNHLDIHRGMQEYIDAKKQVFLAQSPADRVVLNLDNDITRGFAADAKAAAFWFSRKEIPENGCYLKDDVIWYAENGISEQIMPRREIFLRGLHNVENYMAAIAALHGIVPVAVMAETARNFEGVEHRIEFVRELHGVRYYNDSIASAPTRVIAGLKSFEEPIVLIAGGYDKQIPFEPLAPVIVERVKALILCGHTADKIRAVVEACPGYDPKKLPITTYSSFSNAVNAAQNAAAPGDVVMLSPACAAFDMFDNFMHRGRVFKELVRGLE